MERFVLFTVNGLTFGAIYASVALALVIIWRATRELNFALGAQATVSAYVAWVVTDATGSYWAGFAAALIAGFLLGAAVKIILFRDEAMPHLNVIIIGIGLLVLLQAVLGMVFDIQVYRALGSAFSLDILRVGDVRMVSRQDLFAVGSVLATVAGMGLLMTRTPTGLRMRAAAFAPDTARLMGVKVPRMLTFGWALSGFAAALAAMLVAPTQVELIPQSMDGVFILGFTAAVVGGLDSPVGAIVGGLAAGLLLSYATGYIAGGADLLYPAALVLLVSVLLVRPSGIFSAPQARAV